MQKYNNYKKTKQKSDKVPMRLQKPDCCKDIKRRVSVSTNTLKFLDNKEK